MASLICRIVTFLLAINLLTSATHIGPKYDTRPRNHLDIFAKQYAVDHQLTFLNTGIGSLIDAKEGVWIINLISRQMLTIKEGRRLAADLTFQLLYKIYHDPSFANYCKVAADFYRSAELKDEYVGFSITFWDQDTNRPLDPYLAQIRLVDGNLYYYYADPKTQKLQKPVLEPLTSLNLPCYK